MAPPVAHDPPSVADDDAPEMTWAELDPKNTTARPDGILGRAWVLALDDEMLALESRLIGVFSRVFSVSRAGFRKCGTLGN